MTNELGSAGDIGELNAISMEFLEELTSETSPLTKKYSDTTEAIKSELESVSNAIETWEKIAPQLYHIRKRLIVCDELLSGKRDVESISAIPILEGVSEKKKRGPQKGVKKAFIRRKSDILTDAVIGKIRDFISSDEDYHKAKEIYGYLTEHSIIPPYSGATPDRVFAIALSRVEQDELKYNNHYSIMAWGLPDFGTPEHARRKALKQSAKGKEGTRVSSYGRKEQEPSTMAVMVD